MSNDNLFGTAGVWERVIGGADVVWPDEDVVRAAQRFFGDLTPEEHAQRRALDIGFGSGRHIILLASQGFQTAGIDVAQAAVEQTTDKLNRAGLKADFRVEELSSTTFEPGSFDFIVAWGVLFLKPDAELKADLRKVYDLLKPGGAMIANFRTLNNWFYGFGEQQGENLYLLDERAEGYAGILYRFFDQPELEATLKEAGFDIAYTEYKEWRKFGTQTHSWWLAGVRKPEAE